MTDRRNDDLQIENLFRAARRADEASTPPFESVRRASRASKGRSPWVRALRLAVVTGAAGVTLASAAWFLLVERVSAPRPVAELNHPVPLDESQRTAVRKYVPPHPEAVGTESRPRPAAIPAPPSSPASKPAPAARALSQEAVITEAEEKLLASLGDTSEATGEAPDVELLTGETEIVELAQTAQVVRLSDELIQDIPVPGRFYESVVTLAPESQDADGDGNPNVHGSRDRDFKAIVTGVSNVEALTGQQMSQVNPNSIAEMEVITAGASVEFSRAQGGFARIIQKQGSEELELFNTERYGVIQENGFRSVTDHPLSTFSIDVDTASYANVRRFLRQGRRPPRDAVRIEEMINYFDYDYPQPAGDVPFSASIEVAACPWNLEHRLARIGLKGREVERGEYRGTNLVFLIDVSGSMRPRNKLPLLKKALRLLVDQLDGRDQLAMVVYAGSSGLVLPSTSGDEKGTIRKALSRLETGGSTNGGSGLRLAYRIARENFITGGVNRVILATDGDFNVGVTQRSELLGLIQKDADNGIFLTALGVGMGNYKDDTLELLADKGNGNYAYIDSLREARKVLVEEVGGTLVTIAKDVKIQVEFNPAEVGAYRLIGYENRMLRKEDFNDDTKDAGEIGASHTVTALYELIPPSEARSLSTVDPLKYQTSAAPSRAAADGELFTLKLRYKDPEGQASKLQAFPVADEGLALEAASDDFRFAGAVAMFGMILRDSSHRGSATLDEVQRLGLESMGADEQGHRAEFQELVGRAITILGDESGE